MSKKPEDIKPPIDENALKWGFGNHPLDQMSIWFSGEAYDWQRKIIADCSVINSRVIWALNNEAGKTSEILPSIGLAYMAAFPGCQVLSTAGVERQVKEQLFRYLMQKLRPYPEWLVSVDGMKVKAPVMHGLQSTWVGYVPKDAITAEGFHRGWHKDDKGKWRYCPLVFMIDEAKAATQAMFDAVERINPDVWLVLSTPGPLEGPFYENFDQDSYDIYGNNIDDEWTSRGQVSHTDCPHLMSDINKERVRRLIKKHGDRSPLIQSMFFGRFCSPDDLYVFGDYIDDIKHAMSGRVIAIPGHRRAAMDLSGGGDEQTLAIYQGTELISWQQFRMRDTDLLAQRYLKELHHFGVKPEHTTADNGGLGQAVIDNMHGRGFRSIYRYMFNDPARNHQEYVSKAAEDHFSFRALLRAKCVQLPEDKLLLQQMRERKFGMDENNRVKLEKKDALRKKGKSPDRLETIVMVFSDYAPQDETILRTKHVNVSTTEGMSYDPSEMEMNFGGQTTFGGDGGMWCEQ